MVNRVKKAYGGADRMAEAARNRTAISLARLAASGRHVIVQCARCSNRRLARPSDIDLSMDIDAVRRLGSVVMNENTFCSTLGPSFLLMMPIGSCRDGPLR